MLTPHIFDTHQKACEAATPGQIISKKWVYKLTYSTDADAASCCERKYSRLPAQDRSSCKDYSELHGCEVPAPKIETFECIPTPSYSVEPSKGRE